MSSERSFAFVVLPLNHRRAKGEFDGVDAINFEGDHPFEEEVADGSRHQIHESPNSNPKRNLLPSRFNACPPGPSVSGK